MIELVVSYSAPMEEHQIIRRAVLNQSLNDEVMSASLALSEMKANGTNFTEEQTGFLLVRPPMKKSIFFFMIGLRP